MGGLFNVIDRATPCSFLFTIDGYPPNTLIHNVVIDYFTFGGNTAIFNVPDITILIGVIGSCVIYFCLTIYSYIKERNKVSAS
jgi:lipoprotein signal peptidase